MRRSLTPYLFDGLAIALLLGGMAGLFYAYRVNHLMDGFERGAVTALGRASQLVNAEIEMIAGDTLLLASDPEHSPQAAVEAKFKALLQLRPSYRGAAYIDKRGNELLRVERRGPALVAAAEPLPMAPQPNRLRAMTLSPGQLYASAPMPDAADSTAIVIHFSSPVFDDDLHRQGAVVMTFGVDALLGSLEGLSRGADGYFDLVDRSGKPLATARPPADLPGTRHRWTKDIPLVAAAAVHDSHLILQYSIAEDVVAAARRIEALWAFGIWLIVLIPAAACAGLARGARENVHRTHLALAENQERLLEAEQLARIGYWSWQASGDLLVLSPQAAAMLGREAGEQRMKLTEATALHALEDDRSFLERIAHVMSTGETSPADIRIATLRGDRWLHTIIRPARDAEHNIVGVFGTLQDITARKKAEEELRSLQADYMALLDHLPAGVSYMDMKGRCIMVNQTVLQRSGMKREQFEGRLYSEIFHPQDAERRLHANFEAIRTQTPQLGLIQQVKAPDGKPRWLRVDSIPRRDGNGQVIGVVVFTVDITQLKNAEQRLQEMATHDPLTDLCNRRLLTDRLSQALAQSTRHDRHCALLFIDLDRFKQVNDEHGHDIGDALLVQVAQRLRGCVRAEDTIARIGGDEFVVLLAAISSVADAMAVAEKVRLLLHEAFDVQDLVLQIGCSIGVAAYPEHGRTEHDLMCAADAAMYAAKTSGRGTVRSAAPISVPVAAHDAA